MICCIIQECSEVLRKQKVDNLAKKEAVKSTEFAVKHFLNTFPTSNIWKENEQKNENDPIDVCMDLLVK